MPATNKLILGTAQFGLDYGINNKAGKPSDETLTELLDFAYESDIRILDSAEAYGDALTRIGKYHATRKHRFSVISRYSPKRNDLPESLLDRVKENIAQAGVTRLYAYMYHSLKDFQENYDHLAEDIRRLKEEGLIERFGVSVYSNSECRVLADDPLVDMIQMPFNVFDNLNERGAMIDLLRRRGKEVHARSVYLQGLIFTKPGELLIKLRPMRKYINVLDQLAADAGISLAHLALGYVLQSPVDYAVIGVDSIEHLMTNLSNASARISQHLFDAVNEIHIKEKELLSPVNWHRVRVLVITQARTGSTRLPGKVLMKVRGVPLLQTHLQRILRSEKIDLLLVATTTEPADEEIVALAKNMRLPFFRGSERDVLERYYEAASLYQPDVVVRVTSDCPLNDGELIDEVIEHFRKTGVDYCSNSAPPTFPNGMDVEVFTFEALKRAHAEATLPSDREHVTPYIIRNSTLHGGTLFTSSNYASDTDYSELRLTVDEKEDFEVVAQLIERLGNGCGWREYAETYLSDKALHSHNAKYRRNEGYEKSLENDNLTDDK